MLTEDHASSGVPLTAAEYDLAAHTINAHQDVINQIPGSVAVPDLNADWTTASNINAGETPNLCYSEIAAIPVLSSNRYVINDTNAYQVAGYWVDSLSDSARIIWARATFEMTVGSTSGQTATLLFLKNAFAAGVIDASNNQSPGHVVFTPTGWIAQVFDYPAGGSLAISTLASRTYSSAPGTAVQTVSMRLDIAAQKLYVTGYDGVEVAIGPDARFASMVASWAGAEILYVNASTDGRVKFRTFQADSVVGGRTQAAFYSDPLTTKGDLAVRSASATVRQAVGADGLLLTADSSQTSGVKWAPLPPVFVHSFQNAWAVGQMGTPSYIDRARTFTKIRYVPSIPNTGTFTAELRDINTGTTFSGTSAAAAASVKYKEITGTFTFAAGDMPYVYMTATAGAAGLGCDVWLIP